MLDKLLKYMHWREIDFKSYVVVLKYSFSKRWNLSSSEPRPLDHVTKSKTLSLRRDKSIFWTDLILQAQIPLVRRGFNDLYSFAFPRNKAPRLAEKAQLQGGICRALLNPKESLSLQGKNYVCLLGI